jgi:type IV secretory pathway VirB10-like protein
MRRTLRYKNRHDRPLSLAVLALAWLSMNQRFLMWGLASIAFVVTLAISSWHEGLWPSDEATTRGNRATALASTDSTELPAQPFAPEHPAPATPAAAVVTPPEQQAPAQTDAATPAEPPPPMPVAEAEVDTREFLAHRDRAAQHSSRAR